MKRFIEIIQRITTARTGARIGNEKNKNIIVQRKFGGKTPTWKILA
jgi:hypothetical protein